jgi:RNA polymerase-binding transcription factor DksA
MSDVIDSNGLDGATLARIRAELEAERDLLVHQLELHDAGREDRSTATDSFGETEHLTLLEHKDVMGRVDTMSRTALADAEAALARIDAGTYGACLACGGAIPVERLEARPASGHCISCQQALETS